MDEKEQILLAAAVLTLVQFWTWLFIVGRLGKRLKLVEQKLGINQK